MSSLFPAAETPSHSAFPSGAEDLAYALLKSDLVAFALVDSGNIVAASPALREMLGAAAPYQHIDGRNLLSLVAEIDVPGVAEFCRTTLHDNARAEYRCHLVRADATVLPVLLTAAPVPVEGVHQLLIVVSDVSPWVHRAFDGERAMTFAALDRATGFPTHNLLLDRAKIALAAARRYRRRAALLRMELDRLRPLLQSL
ncbi:MAG TPA: PAS domain-containing protein, partial [Burkholderiaceae bacterium]|nr:PAS domain-containing protein [Burkholderiaceae bacterium]